jgi:hypothetical protein
VEVPEASGFPGSLGLRRGLPLTLRRLSKARGMNRPGRACAGGLQKAVPAMERRQNGAFFIPLWFDCNFGIKYSIDGDLST